MKKTIKLINAKEINEGRDAVQILIKYSVIDSNLIGKPEEKSSTKHYTIMVGISRTLLTMWSGRDEKISNPRNLEKVFFEYAKRHIKQKIEEQSILEHEELWLATNTQPNECPFDADKIIIEDELETKDEQLMEDLSLLQLATSIIEIRDYINAKFKELYGSNLLFLKTERDLLNLFKNAYSIEDFNYRVSALRNLVTDLNVDTLRLLTKTTDKQIGSISLLEKLISKNDKYESLIISTFKSINRLRQSYPTHSDNADGVQKAFKYFNVQYPVFNFSESWLIILKAYREALHKLLSLLMSCT